VSPLLAGAGPVAEPVQFVTALHLRRALPPQFDTLAEEWAFLGLRQAKGQ